MFDRLKNWLRKMKAWLWDDQDPGDDGPGGPTPSDVEMTLAVTALSTL